MANVVKSSLQSLIAGEPLPTLPGFDPSWSLKRYNDEQTLWQRKLLEYLRRLIQRITGDNILNEVIQQTSTTQIVQFGAFPGTNGLLMEIWLEYPWPQSRYPLYGDGAVYGETQFDASPPSFPATEPFWRGMIPQLDFNVGSDFSVPVVNQADRLSHWSAMRFTGFLTFDYAEVYTLSVDSDNGIRLWLDGGAMVNNWICSPGGRTNTCKFAASAGQKVAFKLEYFNADDGGHMHFNWSSATQVSEVIPFHKFSRV